MYYVNMDTIMLLLSITCTNWQAVSKASDHMCLGGGVYTGGEGMQLCRGIIVSSDPGFPHPSFATGCKIGLIKDYSLTFS